MDDHRFEQLLAAARVAFTTKGDDLPTRSRALRQYRQTLDLLELESTPAQWARVQTAIANDWSG